MQPRLSPRLLTCMAIKKTVLSLCICLFVLGLRAQQTTVIGNAPALKKSVLYLYTIDDFVNSTHVLLDSAVVNGNGGFTLKANIPQTCFSYIMLGAIEYDLYLEPGKQLYITIPDTAGFRKDSLLKPLDFTGNSADDINTLIADFDAEYSDFMLANYKLILRKTAAKPFADFIKAQHEKYDEKGNSYFKNYVNYRLASLEVSAYIKAQNNIVKLYFNSKPVLYTNDAYMDLFNQIYEDDLKEFVLTAKGKNLLTAINVNIDYTKALNELKRDSTLQNDTVRELYLIKGLGELFYQPGMVKYSILELLKYASTNALTAENKLIAKHLVDKLDKLRIGTAAPNFTLKNIVSGQQVSLADFKGKVVYLSFWDEDNVASVQEIDLIKELDKTYGRKIAFVSICNSANETKTLAFISRNKYKWVFLNSQGNKQLLANYEVLSYPAFYLIDAKGNILKYPADKPSGSITRTLDELYNKK